MAYEALGEISASPQANVLPDIVITSTVVESWHTYSCFAPRRPQRPS
jgi:hypothetical protein